MTVEQLTAEMTEYEFRQWEAFDLIEPIGDFRTDLLLTALRASLLNCNRSESTPPFLIDDLLPKWGEKAIERAKTTEEIALDLQQSMQNIFGARRVTNVQPSQENS
jgi:hypothetical protein